ncbi:hypothetical protein GBA52_013517 [Prunus armeniaca]|nr:hypothetical protein GBA52_013517 [Prunus armeniaca]
MLADHEVEWIWWVDSDAIFTDMEFKLLLERYKDHNLVVHGWWHLIYKEGGNVEEETCIEGELVLWNDQIANLKNKGYWKDKLRRPLSRTSHKLRRPFVTHFTGCEPCSGEHNPAYTWEACWKGMQKALNYADSQVRSRFGFVHPDLLKLSLVTCHLISQLE